MSQNSLGIIGCGSMGEEICTFLNSGKIQNAELLCVFDQDENKLQQFSKNISKKILLTSSINEFLAIKKINLVVECASPVAVKKYGELILKSNKNFLAMSSGAFNDPKLFKSLSEIAKQKLLKILIPSGAIGGIDAIKSIQNQIEKVSITTTKHPRSLIGAPGFKPFENQLFNKTKVIFNGTAQDAIEMFPANVNVSTTLSLASIGTKKNQVKIICDPKTKRNKHEVCIVGPFGKLNFSMDLEPNERNPKTSSLAIYSVIQTIQQFCNPNISLGT